MRSRPGIFIALIAGMVALPSMLGFVVYKGSQSAAPGVREQTRLYEEQRRNQPSQQAVEQQPNAPLAQQDATQQVEVEQSPETQNSQGAEIVVYFSKSPESENDPNRVFPVQRNVDEQSPVDVAINALIAGPTSQEKADGFSGGLQLSGDSNCGSDYKLTVEGGTAKLQFCKHKENQGIAQQSRERAQLTNTLQQLTGAQSVQLLDRDGKCLYDTDCRR